MNAALDLASLPDPDDIANAWDGDDPAYLTWWRALTAWQEASGADRTGVWRSVVDEHRLLHRYAHAIPNAEALRALRELGPLLEVGAGTGYWSRLLRDCGADVMATDIDAEGRDTGWCSTTRWTDVLQRDAETAMVTYPDRAVFACWPTRPGMSDLIADGAFGRPVALVTDGLANPFDGLLDRLVSDWTLQRTVALPTWFIRTDELTIWIPK